MQWSKPKEADQCLADCLQLRSRLLGLRASLSFLQFYRLAVKAGFKDKQPRHPKGTPDVAGRWRDAGGSPKTPPRQPRLTPDPKTPPKGPRLKPPGIGHNRPPRASVPKTPPEPPPKIPTERPPAARARTKIAKSVAVWVLRMVARRALGPVGILLDVIDVVRWMQQYYPYIQSYFDGPKTLEELQSFADEPQVGYEIHHIVEKTAAGQDGFPADMIEGYDNLVRVPTYRHHEITGWYQRPTADFGGLTPRQYLRGKSWEEKYEVGLYAMKRFGVIK